MLRQLEFATFDFKLHQTLYQNKEVRELLDQIRDDIGVIIPPKNTHFENSFSHIFAGGYAAGYYSYKWAEVLSADAFYAFIDNNFDKTIALKYKNEILKKGSSQSMSHLFFNLMNRELDTNALLRLSGIN